MTLPLSSGALESYANTLDKKLRGCYQNVLDAQSQIASDRFDLVVNFPRFNKNLQDVISEITNSGHQSEIVAYYSSTLPSSITVSDVVAFVTAFGNLASDIESNISLFLATINATSKKLEFVTPIAAPVKTALNNRIAAILATVS